MQTNKASETTTKELKQWLAKPGTSAEAGLGINTQQDLQWLENTKDLSSIALKNEEDEASDLEAQEKPTPSAGGGGGGLMALFGCGGKRK